jgi:hypothetical protein
MFHLKILNKETHADLSAIKATIVSNPTRKFTIELNGYNFPGTKVKELIKSKCGVCIKKEHGYSDNLIKEFINLGNETVVFLAKDFSESELEEHLDKGASVIVGRSDGFDAHQIKKLVVYGQEKGKVFVLGGQLLESHYKNILISGGSVLFKHLDLHARKIAKLLLDGEGRIYIQNGSFTNVSIDKFLKGKANVIFGKGNLLSKDRIKEKVEKYKSQIRIESNHPTFDTAWVKEMEELGAIII